MGRHGERGKWEGAYWAERNPRGRGGRRLGTRMGVGIGHERWRDDFELEEGMACLVLIHSGKLFKGRAVIPAEEDAPAKRGKRSG